MRGWIAGSFKIWFMEKMNDMKALDKASEWCWLISASGVVVGGACG
jgi:hypothetical protein